MRKWVIRKLLKPIYPDVMYVLNSLSECCGGLCTRSRKAKKVRKWIAQPSSTAT